MPTNTTPMFKLPLRGLIAGFRRFTVAEYHTLLEMGMITEDDNLELLDGHLVKKMSRNPPHDGTLRKVEKRIQRVLLPPWDTRSQMGVTLSASEPEPDLAVVREDPSGYTTRHPAPADVGLLIEVADTSLDTDRSDKVPLYAQDGIVEYWIVNIPERQIEVYTQPSGPTALPAYGARQTYRPGQSIPFVLNSVLVTAILVVDLLP